jgi:hypothetical protein
MNGCASACIRLMLVQQIKHRWCIVGAEPIEMAIIVSSARIQKEAMIVATRRKP